MAKLRIKEDGTENDLLGRPCTLNAGRKEAKGFQMVAKGKTSLAEREVLWKTRKDNPIAEYYIELTLEKLREIDKDLLKLKKFLTSRLPKVGGETTNVIIVRLLMKEGDIIKNSDYEYLWDMLSISGNDIAVPPVFSWPKMTTFDKEKYERFVKGFVSLSHSYQPDKLACIIPWCIAPGQIKETIQWYKKVQPQVYLMDFGGKKPFDPTREMVMSTLLRNVNDLHANKYYLYGFDVKPHKLGASGLAAENLLLLASGFNAVGPRRSRTPLSKEMIQRLKASPSLPVTESLRVFNPNDYGYYKLKEPALLKQFGEWLPTLKTAKVGVTLDEINEPDKKKVDQFRRLGMAFNYSQQTPEPPILAKKVDSGELKEHLMAKEMAKMVVPKIEKLKRRVGTSGKR